MPEVKIISSSDARPGLSELLRDVLETGNIYVVTIANIPVAQVCLITPDVRGQLSAVKPE